MCTCFYDTLCQMPLCGQPKISPTQIFLYLQCSSNQCKSTASCIICTFIVYKCTLFFGNYFFSDLKQQLSEAHHFFNLDKSVRILHLSCVLFCECVTISVPNSLKHGLILEDHRSSYFMFFTSFIIAKCANNLMHSPYFE